MRAAADLAAMLSERDGLPRDAGADISARLARIQGAARDRIRQIGPARSARSPASMTTVRA